MKKKSVLLLLAVFFVFQSEWICMEIFKNINVYISLGGAILLWLFGSILVYIQMKKHNLEYSFYETKRIGGNDYTVIFFSIMGGLAIAASNYIYGGLMPLIAREYFSGDILYTLRNVLYYPLEVLLMLELIICGQKTGELCCKNNNIPFGAATLFFLWGLPHIIWHGWEDGIISALMSFIYCIPFYASKKNFKIGYIGMLILWMM